ncbi:MAG: hypothetical protein OES57_09915, partial [Acidimicrobiia bacterium]|nr:hypothetical protein [Acidimicrobiia bacterium]
MTTPVERAVARRTAWMVVDQAANSLFSLLAGLAAARLLGVSEFGLFATLFAAYLVARDSLRALVLDPMIVRHAAAGTEGQARIVLGLALVAGGLVGIVTLFVAAAWDELDPATALVFAVTLVPLLVVDTLRSVDVMQGRPDRAAALSTVLLVAAVALGFWIPIVHPTAGAALAALFAGAIVAALSRWRSLRVETSVSVLGDWIGEHRSVGVPIFLDYLASAGAVSLAAFVLAAIDIEQAAGLRGAQMVAAPVVLLYVALTQALTAEGSRVRESSAAAISRFGRWVLVAMAVAGGAATVAVAVAVEPISELFGDSASVVEPVLVPMMLFTLASGP